MSKKSRSEHLITIMRILSLISFILAVVFIVLLFLSKNDNIQLWYQTYQDILVDAETKVTNMDDKASVLIVLLFLFAFKAVFPIYLFPLSALCAVTSTVFPPYLSIPINILGLVILYSIKYLWGKRVGANGVQTILSRSETVQDFIEKDGKGNPLLIPLFRLIPAAPINLVSQLYGAMGFRFRDFILLSLLGYCPRLISYTFIGQNVFNPLSAAFLLPFILLFTLASVSLFASSKVVETQIVKRRKLNNG